jgi:deoxyhypusine synthase
MAINDTRLDIIKDVVKTILNETTDMDDTELKEIEYPNIDDVIEFKDKDSITDETIGSIVDELEYDNYILKLASQIERLGRKLDEE